MWDEISKPWQASFEQAWEAYCHDSIPIGAVVVDGSENIISRGRGRHFENTAPEGQICSTDLAHAELNALIQLNKDKHPDIYAYTLYTTVEPCALCFGAFYMSSVRNLRYAARDPYGGSTNLYGTTEYLKRKEKSIVGPDIKLEVISMVITTCFHLKNCSSEFIESLLKLKEKDCPEGIALGRAWAESKRLIVARNKGTEVHEVIKEIHKAIDWSKFSSLTQPSWLP